MPEIGHFFVLAPTLIYFEHKNLPNLGELFESNITIFDQKRSNFHISYIRPNYISVVVILVNLGQICDFQIMKKSCPLPNFVLFSGFPQKIAKICQNCCFFPLNFNVFAPSKSHSITWFMSFINSPTPFFKTWRD